METPKTTSGDGGDGPVSLHYTGGSRPSVGGWGMGLDHFDPLTLHETSTPPPPNLIRPSYIILIRPQKSHLLAWNSRQLFLNKSSPKTTLSNCILEYSILHKV